MAKDIKFEYGSGEMYRINSDSTALTQLFMLGALAHTSKNEYENGKTKIQYATDEEGLKDSIETSSELLTMLHDSLAALGVLLVHVERVETEDYMASMGWLICGLSEICEQVAFNQVEMQTALDQLKETNQSQ